MAWNKYYIMISNQEKPITEKQLEELHLGNYRSIGKVNLFDTNKPQTLFTGHYNNSIIIVHPYLPFKFFEDEQSEEEKAFINCFPNSKIAALVENSTVGMFGFSIIVNGKKIRMKDGADGEIYNNEGIPLPEEDKSYKEFKEMMDKAEKEEIIEDMGEDGFEDYLKFESAWGMPNILSKEFLGEYVGSINGEKIEFVKYEEN